MHKQKQSTGKKGEAMAVSFFKEKGFTILETNWRYARFEIDIIAAFENKIHFIEVKTRTSHRFGYPEESVNTSKLKKIMVAADAYLEANNKWKQVQYDVLAITVLKDKEPVLEWFEDYST